MSYGIEKREREKVIKGNMMGRLGRISQDESRGGFCFIHGKTIN